MRNSRRRCTCASSVGAETPGFRRGLLAAGAIAILVASAHAVAAAEPELRFTDVTEAAGIDFVETIGDDHMSNIVESTGVGCGFIDYDADGWMDIYLVSGCWTKGLSDPKLDAAERKRLAAVTDRLYRNLGNGKFEDVTVKAGVDRLAYGMGVVVADYDGDGDADIYVTNYGPNFLYRNNGDGTFTDVAKQAGVDLPLFSVGAVFFDYDRDGWLDLYVGNYIEFDPDYTLHYAPDGFPGPEAYTGQQDRLFHGNGDGTFTDVTAKAGIEIEPIGRAMGVGAFDYDDDGLLDVFVSNDAMENFLLHNSGDGTFENRAWDEMVALGEGGGATAAMGVEIADYDADGRFDVFVPDMRYNALYHKDAEGFSNVSVQSHIAEACGQYHSWGSAFADFDLDGHIDLYISNGSVHHLESHEDVLFLGDGQGRFTDVSERTGDWVRRKFVSRGMARADIDNDGDIDLLIASLNSRPVLLRNDIQQGGRHWLGVDLIGKGGNRDAIGATVTAKIGNRSLRAVRLSGGSYLSQHDRRLHFGLGTSAKVDVLEVVWPDGSRQKLENVPADKYLTVAQKARR